MPLSYAQRITDKIETAFAPCNIVLTDDSNKHVGHAGADPSGETHFTLQIVSDKFHDMSRIQRHQAVYEVLENEIKERVHALRIEAKTFDEAEGKSKPQTS